mmetsp:Transcript_36022/g.87045  ORF Transcript_36022/g.87045 Transcript_36022/m.87045 type:complete len:187 (-) Transcript_36022:1208-1768(-)
MADSIPLLAVDEILATFDTPPRVSNPPTYEEIRELKRTIHRNAGKIRSLNGGGNHGHLAITMTAAEYANRSLIAWTQPAPPPATLTIPANASALNASIRRDNYKKLCNTYFLQGNVSRALKKQIEEAVPSEFLDEIRDEWQDLDIVSLPQIFDHLLRQPSSTVTPEDVETTKRTRNLIHPQDTDLV